MRAIPVLLAIAIGLATPAAAERAQGRTIACYRQVTVPAKYKVRRELVKKAYRAYVYYPDRVELVEYPAVYREIKTLIKPSYKVLREIPCKKKR